MWSSSAVFPIELLPLACLRAAAGLACRETGGPSWGRTSDQSGEIDSQRDTTLMVDRSVNHQVVRFQLPFPEPCMHLSMHTALQRCVLLKLFPSVSSDTATAFYAFSCTPSPCIGHCPDHLSTMGAPSPYISRYVGDPQVPTSSCSVRRSPVRWFPPSLGAATEGIFTRSLNFTE